MKQLAASYAGDFRDVRFLLTDMDETLTHRGQISAAVFRALEQLRASGVHVIVVTAAPAGWCDQMTRMWPVDGVIGENGGFFFCRNGPQVTRHFWHSNEERARLLQQLASISDHVRAAVPGARLAEDQPFRLTSLGFARTGHASTDDAIISALLHAGLSATRNNLWLLGWLGAYNKLNMANRVLMDHFGLDAEAAREAVCYSGDSENDAPMFRFFRHSIGMSTVRDEPLSAYPTWITRGPGGAGFVEVAEAILTSRA
jgi:hypothetical protein